MYRKAYGKEHDMFPLDCYRRSYDRYDMDPSSKVCLNTPLNEEMMLKNLSARGAGAVGSRYLQAQESLDLVITSSLLKEPLRTRAKVAWCRQIENNLYQTGFDFGLDNTIDLSEVAHALYK